MRVEVASGRTPSRSVIASLIGLIVAAWAGNFIAAKIGLRYLPTLTMASFRVCAAGLVMAPAYWFCRLLPNFAEAAEASKRRFTGRDWWTLFYLGFFGMTVNQMCFTVGLHYTSVSHAAVIVGIGPIYTLILAVLLRLEKVTWHKATGMAIAFTGIAVLTSERGTATTSPSLIGDAITMTGSVGFAMYAVLAKRVAHEYDALTMTTYNQFAGAIMVLPVALRQARLLGGMGNWLDIPWSAWAAVLYMAIFGSAAAYVAYFWLLRYLEASQLSAFTYVLPVLATILGILWLGERGTWNQLLGGAIALGGVYWTESGRVPK